MGAPMGVMSGKFVIKAGILLVAARIDMHTIVAAIDPSQPISIASPDLVQKVGPTLVGQDPAERHSHHAIGMDHQEISLDPAMEGDPLPGAEYVIGSDLLSSMAVGFDFRHFQMRVFDRAEYRRLGHDMAMVAAKVTPDHCLSLDGVDSDGRRIHVALSGNAADAARPGKPISIGNIPVTQYGKSARCFRNDYTIGWNALAGRKLVIDLSNRRAFLK